MPGGASFRGLRQRTGTAAHRQDAERAGFVPDGAQEAYEVGGRSTPGPRYRRPLTSGAEPPAAPSLRSPGP